MTDTGRSLLVIVPSPSRPLLFDAQQDREAPARAAQLCELMAAVASVARSSL